jgi:hypothetical protein
MPLLASAAIVTLPHSSFANGLVRVEFDYNQGNGNVVRFRCINDSDQYAWFGVYLMDYASGAETLVGERYCAPHETITQNVPGVSVAWACEYYDNPDWPPDCGLAMGNYQFRARYPAY